MTHVLTLIGDPRAASLDDATAERAADAIGGGLAGETRWLAPGIACDIPFDGIAPAHAEAAARTALRETPVDLYAQQAEGRRKRLLVADMDSTIISVECVDELADFAGLRTEISAITTRAMRGEIGFESALRERVAMLAGLPVSALEAAYQERIRTTPGARELVRTMESHGAVTALVSGGFTFFTERVAQCVGFSRQRANKLETETRNGVEVLSGRVHEPILGAGAKVQALTEFVEALGIALDDVIAVGDGANDIPMLELAGLGVAFRAKPRARDAADARIDHGDLTALLYLQGYRRGEFLS